jgi:hypothetical protein
MQLVQLGIEGEERERKREREEEGVREREREGERGRERERERVRGRLMTLYRPKTLTYDDPVPNKVWLSVVHPSLGVRGAW